MTDQLATIPYDIIRDKDLTSHDSMFKLIIIGDSCKYYLPMAIIRFMVFSVLGSCWQKLSAFSRHGRRIQSGAPSDDRGGVRVFRHQDGREDNKVVDMGYGRTRIVPLGDQDLLQGRTCCLSLLRSDS